ncbi:hypothetical protein J6590_040839 [Homalodisca vitripennis]|nr:hypothetical protein J6590_040839 [Homalodisca vitripennis]
MRFSYVSFSCILSLVPRCKYQYKSRRTHYRSEDTVKFPSALYLTSLSSLHSSSAHPMLSWPTTQMGCGGSTQAKSRPLTAHNFDMLDTYLRLDRDIWLAEKVAPAPSLAIVRTAKVEGAFITAPGLSATACRLSRLHNSNGTRSRSRARSSQPRAFLPLPATTQQQLDTVKVEGAFITAPGLSATACRLSRLHNSNWRTRSRSRARSSQPRAFLPLPAVCLDYTTAIGDTVKVEGAFITAPGLSATACRLSRLHNSNWTRSRSGAFITAPGLSATACRLSRLHNSNWTRSRSRARSSQPRAFLPLPATTQQQLDTVKVEGAFITAPGLSATACRLSRLHNSNWTRSRSRARSSQPRAFLPLPAVCLDYTTAIGGHGQGRGRVYHSPGPYCHYLPSVWTTQKQLDTVKIEGAFITAPGLSATACRLSRLHKSNWTRSRSRARSSQPRAFLPLPATTQQQLDTVKVEGAFITAPGLSATACRLSRLHNSNWTRSRSRARSSQPRAFLPLPAVCLDYTTAIGGHGQGRGRVYHSPGPYCHYLPSVWTTQKQLDTVKIEGAFITAPGLSATACRLSRLHKSNWTRSRSRARSSQPRAFLPLPATTQQQLDTVKVEGAFITAPGLSATACRLSRLHNSNWTRSRSRARSSQPRAFLPLPAVCLDYTTAIGGHGQGRGRVYHSPGPYCHYLPSVWTTQKQLDTVKIEGAFITAPGLSATACRLSRLHKSNWTRSRSRARSSQPRAFLPLPAVCLDYTTAIGGHGQGRGRVHHSPGPFCHCLPSV